MAMSHDTVPPGTTDLLHVSLEGTGHIVVNDSSNVRFIDAHAKRHGSNYDLGFSAHEMFLHNFTSGRRHAGVVSFGCRGHLRVWLLGIRRILPIKKKFKRGKFNWISVTQRGWVIYL